MSNPAVAIDSSFLDDKKRSPKSPVEPLPNDDPFAAANFAADGEAVPTGIDDVSIEVGAPSDEEFVLRQFRSAAQPEGEPSRRQARRRLRQEPTSLLTPAVAAFCKSQSSLKKFFKAMRIFLYVTSEGGYGLWLIRDSLDNWSVSDLGVVQQAKKIFTRRYTDGKVRKGHTSNAIPIDRVQFPDKALTGSDGILKQAFGEAFAINSTDHPVINRLAEGVKQMIATSNQTARLTPKQQESIGRFFARVQSANPSIKHLWVADSEFHSQFKSPGSDLMNGQGGRARSGVLRLPQSDHRRDHRTVLSRGRSDSSVPDRPGRRHFACRVHGHRGTHHDARAVGPHVRSRFGSGHRVAPHQQRRILGGRS